MSKYKNINSSIIYYVLTITLDVSSIGTHMHLLVLVIYYSIIRLYCLQPIVLGIILTQGMSTMSFRFERIYSVHKRLDPYWKAAPHCSDDVAVASWH
jgi:hypothetical protein